MEGNIEDLKLLDQLEVRRFELEFRITELNNELDILRAQVKSDIAPLAKELSTIAKKIDELRARNFPRMAIG